MATLEVTGLDRVSNDGCMLKHWADVQLIEDEIQRLEQRLEARKQFLRRLKSGEAFPATGAFNPDNALE